MTYQCPKGHQSTDADYCSECGALIGQSKLADIASIEASNLNISTNGETVSGELCPDCGTPRVGAARFCEVCRHDFQDNKTGVAEAIIASQVPKPEPVTASEVPKVTENHNTVMPQRLNIMITVDRAKAADNSIESAIKPDSNDRVFPLDLDENLVGRRSKAKGIYPEIEINDPGVSHRHLKFIKQGDGSFAVLELGSANGTELNGVQLEPGINTRVKAGDELAIGIWTLLKIVLR